jgi:hypothetical protein
MPEGTASMVILKLSLNKPHALIRMMIMIMMPVTASSQYQPV